MRGILKTGGILSALLKTSSGIRDGFHGRSGHHQPDRFKGNGGGVPDDSHEFSLADDRKAVAQRKQFVEILRDEQALLEWLKEGHE